jgi:hypothetical protein
MGQKKINGSINIIGGNILLDGRPLSIANYDNIRFGFDTNSNYTIDDTKAFASYVRIGGDVTFFIVSFYITKDTIGTGSNPIIVGKFKNIPQEILDNLVADSNDYLDEQNTQAFISGGFTCIGAKTALVKNTTDNTLDLLLETTNMENNQEYHIRYSVALLLTNNVSKVIDSCVVGNLGNQDPTNVTFAKSTDFPSANNIYEEVTIDNVDFLKFTPWYKKPVYNGNELIGFEMANEKADNTYIPYDCFLDESGNVVPYILIAKDTMSQTTISSARAIARAKGSGYQLYDCAMYCFLRDLLIVINESFSFTNVLTFASMTGLSTYIDGLWKSPTSSTHYLYSNKPSLYIDDPTENSNGYVTLSYSAPAENSSAYVITKLGYDSSNPTISLPSALGTEKTITSYYCSAFKSTSSKYLYTYSFRTNLIGSLYMACNYLSSSSGTFRLAYRAIS